MMDQFQDEFILPDAISRDSHAGRLHIKQEPIDGDDDLHSSNSGDFSSDPVGLESRNSSGVFEGGLPSLESKTESENSSTTYSQNSSTVEQKISKQFEVEADGELVIIDHTHGSSRCGFLESVGRVSVEHEVCVDNQIKQDCEFKINPTDENMHLVQSCSHCKKTINCLEGVKMKDACCQCGKTFTEINTLENHINTHFLEKNSVDPHDMLLNNDNHHTCNYCAEGFASNAQLLEHEKDHSSEMFVKSPENVDLRKRDARFSCNQCEDVFDEKSQLTRHLELHTNNPILPNEGGKVLLQREKSHKCDHCGKAFTTKGNLKCHVKIHSGEELHKCTRCGKVYTRKDCLKRHVMRHTGEKPYICDVCGKAFLRKDHLATHVMVHRGIKPHKCSECGKAFNQKGDLNRHFSLHS